MVPRLESYGVVLCSWSAMHQFQHCLVCMYVLRYKVA
jgi:hypothetical protein